MNRGVSPPLFLLLASVCWALAVPAIAQLHLTGGAEVRDGDTLDMEGVRIRLFGIDAPELSQPCTKPEGTRWSCGVAAREALTNKVGNSPLRCERKDIDNYGRVVAVCWLGQEDLNRWLAINGWAVAYRRYTQVYVEAEAIAKSGRLNIWNGSFQLPEDYRRAEESSPTATQNSNCRIKGNISINGDRIYHVPEGKSYAKTVISPRSGERMFCSEREARAAGWRRSRR